VKVNRVYIFNHLKLDIDRINDGRGVTNLLILSVKLVVVVWRSIVSALASINEVDKRQARLVIGWVTVSGFTSRCVTFIPVCNQPSRSTQPGHPFVGRRNEYQPKGGDALRLELYR